MPTTPNEEIWTNPPVVHVTKSDKIQYEVDWESPPTTLTALVSDLTDGGTDVTSAMMPSGAHTPQGNVAIYKQLDFSVAQAVAGHSYLVLWGATVNGDVDHRKTEFIVGYTNRK